MNGGVRAADGDRPFPGARLSLVSEAGAEVAASVADDEGRFVFAGVPSGWYTLVTSGYQPGVNVLPAGGGPRQADIMLTRSE